MNLRTQMMQMTSNDANEVVEKLGEHLDTVVEAPTPQDATVQAALAALAYGLAAPNLLGICAMAVHAEPDPNEDGETKFTTTIAAFGEHEALAFAAWNWAQKQIKISIKPTEFHAAMETVHKLAKEEIYGQPGENRQRPDIEGQPTAH